MNVDFDYLLENIDEYREFITNQDSDLDITEDTIASIAMNPFIRYSSSPRGYMFASHFSQCISLSNPEERIVQTGIEHNFGKSTISKIAETDIEYITTITRYRGFDYHTVNSPVEYIVIFRNLETNQIDSMSIPYYQKHHPYFGFKYEINHHYLSNIGPNEFIPKGTVFAKPAAYTDEFGYAYGLNLNVAMMSLPEVTEDGVVISEDTKNRLKFRIYESRSIEVGEDSFLLNIYGDDENYKPFPDIGEYINETGVVACSRNYQDELAPALYSVKDLQRFDPIFDKACYVRGEGGKVVDIKVYYSNKRKKMLPKDTDNSLNRYTDSLLVFHRQIIDTYEALSREHRSRTGEELIVSESFNNLIIQSYNIVRSSTKKSPIKKIYRKEPMDLYRIEFVIEYEITPTVGFKLTDMHGGKGVIVDIWKNEDMPVDKDGNRSDMIVHPGSTFSRLNIGRLYEKHMFGVSRKAKKLITDAIIKYIGKQNITEDDIDELSGSFISNVYNKFVLETTSIIDNEQHESYLLAYKNKNYTKMREILTEIVMKEFYIYYTIENKKTAYEIVLRSLQKGIKAPYDCVDYTYKGKKIHTKGPIKIAPMYIMLLSKIADGLLATASAKVNPFGLPIGVSKNEKYRYPYRKSPVRNIGEQESRILASYAGREALAELIDRGENTEAHGFLYQNILSAKEPTNIDVGIDRNIIPYGNNKALEILRTLLNSVGADLEHVPYKERFSNVSSDKTRISEIDLDDVEIYEEEDDKDRD